VAAEWAGLGFAESSLDCWLGYSVGPSRLAAAVAVVTVAVVSAAFAAASR